jgi:hypothetical protein
MVYARLMKRLLPLVFLVLPGCVIWKNSIYAQATPTGIHEYVQMRLQEDASGDPAHGSIGRISRDLSRAPEVATLSTNASQRELLVFEGVRDGRICFRVSDENVDDTWDGRDLEEYLRETRYVVQAHESLEASFPEGAGWPAPESANLTLGERIYDSLETRKVRNSKPLRTYDVRVIAYRLCGPAVAVTTRTSFLTVSVLPDSALESNSMLIWKLSDEDSL